MSDLKFGDLIMVYFDSDSCWGNEGFHTGIILYDDNCNKLQIHWLDEDLIVFKNIGVFNPAIDDLEDFLKHWGIEMINVIGNLSTKVVKDE